VVGQAVPPAILGFRRVSQLDFSQFKAAHFEFEKKDDQINMRVPKQLLEAVKARAKARGIPYTRFIRETLEQAMTTPKQQ
jgi:predicted DNA binding CopG/RHH family protein